MNASPYLCREPRRRERAALDLALTALAQLRGGLTPPGAIAARALDRIAVLLAGEPWNDIDTELRRASPATDAGAGVAASSPRRRGPAPAFPCASHKPEEKPR